MFIAYKQHYIQKSVYQPNSDSLNWLHLVEQFNSIIEMIINPYHAVL